MPLIFGILKRKKKNSSGQPKISVRRALGVQRKIAKHVKEIRYIDPDFLNGNHKEFVAAVENMIVEEFGKIPKSGYGLLVVKDRNGGFRRTLFVRSTIPFNFDAYELLGDKKLYLKKLSLKDKGKVVPSAGYAIVGELSKKR